MWSNFNDWSILRNIGSYQLIKSTWCRLERFLYNSCSVMMWILSVQSFIANRVWDQNYCFLWEMVLSCYKLYQTHLDARDLVLIQLMTHNFNHYCLTQLNCVNMYIGNLVLASPVCTIINVLIKDLSPKPRLVFFFHSFLDKGCTS